MGKCKKEVDAAKQLSKFRILIIPIAISIVTIFCIWQNNSITITKADYVNSKIPNEFNDYKIVHISDLHNKKFGKNQEVLLENIKSNNPDIIVITGDLIDRRKYDLDTAMEFVSGAVNLAPVYYVSGNHEAWSEKFSIIKESLVGAGVHILDNTAVMLSKENSSVLIIGIKDPAFLTSSYIEGTDTTEMVEQLKEWFGHDGFKILLSHRPELFELYCENNMDLIFTGHAHGGQFRIPLIGGLVAPDQGLFPKYTSGHHSKKSSTMFISRGLGNSIIPIRLFNRPEIVVVTLKTE